MTAALFMQWFGGAVLLCVLIILAIYALDKVLTEIGMVRRVWKIMEERDKLRSLVMMSREAMLIERGNFPLPNDTSPLALALRAINDYRGDRR